MLQIRRRRRLAEQALHRFPARLVGLARAQHVVADHVLADVVVDHVRAVGLDERHPLLGRAARVEAVLHQRLDGLFLGHLARQVEGRDRGRPEAAGDDGFG